MKTELCGLAGGSQDQPYEWEREVHIFGRGKHLLSFSGVQVGGEPCYCEDKANISNAIVDHGLQGGSVGICAAVPSADEEEGHNPNSLSPNEDLEHIICGNQDYHRDQEDKQVFKEAVHLGVRMHIPGCEL